MRFAIFSAGVLLLAYLSGCAPRGQEARDETAGQSVAQELSDTALTMTDWVLTELRGKEVTPTEPANAPSLQFDTDEHRVSGSAGCNRFGGSYILSGDELSFGPLMSTRMACPSGMDTEQEYLTALADVREWRVVDQHLELSDDGGRVLARFEAGVNRQED